MHHPLCDNFFVKTLGLLINQKTVSRRESCATQATSAPWALQSRWAEVLNSRKHHRHYNPKELKL